MIPPKAERKITLPIKNKAVRILGVALLGFNMASFITGCTDRLPSSPPPEPTKSVVVWENQTPQPSMEPIIPPPGTVFVKHPPTEPAPTLTPTVQSTQTETLTPPPPPTVTATPQPPTETPTVIAERAFYQPEFILPLSAEVSGVPMNIKIGLMSEVRRRSSQPIKEIKVARPDAAQILAETTLKMFWRRYVMENSEIPFEQYLELVKQGKGNVHIAVVDESSAKGLADRSILEIDPRDEIRLVVAQRSLPVIIAPGENGDTIYFARNSNGGLTIVFNFRPEQLGKYVDPISRGVILVRVGIGNALSNVANAPDSVLQKGKFPPDYNVATNGVEQIRQELDKIMGVDKYIQTRNPQDFKPLLSF